MFNWINRNFPDDSLHIGFSTKYYSDLDFLRVNKNGETSVGYTIENLDTTKYQAIRINDLSHQIYNTLKALNKVELSSLCMVFISDDEEKLAIYRKEFNAFRKGLPEKFEFLFGKTELEGESLEPIFIPIVDD